MKGPYQRSLVERESTLLGRCFIMISKGESHQRKRGGERKRRRERIGTNNGFYRG
jgi:hypothetical protein